jgi:hypothetical protein
MSVWSLTPIPEALPRVRAHEDNDVILQRARNSLFRRTLVGRAARQTGEAVQQYTYLITPNGRVETYRH